MSPKIFFISLVVNKILYVSKALSCFDILEYYCHSTSVMGSLQFSRYDSIVLSCFEPQDHCSEKMNSRFELSAHEYNTYDPLRVKVIRHHLGSLTSDDFGFPLSLKAEIIVIRNVKACFETMIYHFGRLYKIQKKTSSSDFIK